MEAGVDHICINSQEGESYDTGSQLLLFFLPSRTLPPQIHGLVQPTFRVGLHISVKPFWKLSYRHNQRFGFWVILDPSKLTVLTYKPRTF